MKLLETTEARFAEERQQLLQQIQDLTNKFQSPVSVLHPPTNSTSPVPSYSDVVRWSTVSFKRHAVKSKLQTSPLSTSNRFNGLQDEHDNESHYEYTPAQEKETPQKLELPSRQIRATGSNYKHRTELTKPKQSRPRVYLFGDSIPKRINGHRLSGNADVVNHNEEGRRLEQVCEDIKDTDLSEYV